MLLQACRAMSLHNSFWTCSFIYSSWWLVELISEVRVVRVKEPTGIISFWTCPFYPHITCGETLVTSKSCGSCPMPHARKRVRPNVIILLLSNDRPGVIIMITITSDIQWVWLAKRSEERVILNDNKYLCRYPTSQPMWHTASLQHGWHKSVDMFWHANRQCCRQHKQGPINLTSIPLLLLHAGPSLSFLVS